MMKPYESYMPIEYDWLEKVPSHWRKTPIRNITKISDKRNNSQDQLELLSVYREYGVIKKSSRDDNHNAESADLSNYKYVNKGYLVINKMKLWQGSLGISQYEGIVSPAYIVCNIFGDFNFNYLEFLLRSPLFKVYYNRISKGIRVGQWDANYDDFKKLNIYFPPRSEQDQIVRYLDWQTSKITTLVQAKKRQIELLKEQKQAIINQAVTKGLDDTVAMKDSGVEWLGEVPAHWEVLLNKRLYKENVRKFEDEETVLSLSQKSGLIPYSQMKERSMHTSTYENWKLVLPNDLVLNRFKAHLGVLFSSAYRGIVTFHYGVYEPQLPILSQYYELLYHTPAYCCIFAGRSNGMTVGLQNLSNQNFYNVYSIYPPLDEQQAIITYLKEKTTLIDKAIAVIEKEIELVTEYKTSLISSVVTGKVDVRGVVVPEFEVVEDTPEREEDEDELEVD